MKEQLTLKLNYANQVSENQFVKDELDMVFNSIKSMELEELYRLLDEEMKSNELGKYYLFAILRDIFQQFNNAGDTELEVEFGGCKMACYESSCKVINIIGNNSEKNFSFVIEKDGSRISGIHSCLFFQNSEGNIITPSEELLSLTLKKQQEMLKKGGGEWDETNGIEMTTKLLRLIKVLGQGKSKEEFSKVVDLIMNLAKG